MTTDNPATTADCFKPHLNQTALSLMANVADHSILIAGGKKYLAINLAYVSKVTEEDNAVFELAGIINKLASLGLIHSTLTPPGIVSLGRQVKVHPATVAYCNVLVPEERLAEARTLAARFLCQEGSVPGFDDLVKELPVGQFYCNISISFGETLVKGYDAEKSIDEAVDNILRLLPKGTSLVSVEKCAIRDLSTEYEAIFQNELLSDFKEVEIEYEHRYVKVNEDFKSVKLPVHIKYLARKDHISIL